MVVSSQGLARLSRVPVIRRAREYRLYTQSGDRIIDCYQDGGRSILGHRPGHVLRDTKNDLDRGLLSGLPSTRTERARKAVQALFPRGQIRFFTSIERACVAVSRLLKSEIRPESIVDPGSSVPSVLPEVMFWRPFLPDLVATKISADRPRVIIPILPSPPLFPVQPVVFFDEEPITEDLIAATALTALISSVAAMVSLDPSPVVRLSGMKVTGPYFVGDSSNADYDRVFNWFLEGGVLLSPEPGSPSILPRTLSDGEWSLLRELAQTLHKSEMIHAD